MIVRDLRIKRCESKVFTEIRSLSVDDVLNIINGKDKGISSWDELGKFIENKLVDISSIDLSILTRELRYKLFPIFEDEFYGTDKVLAYNCNTDIVSKELFSILLGLRDSEELKSYLKKIVQNVDDIESMYFYDFSENNYDEEKTKCLIEKTLNIPSENLYPCYPFNLFKSEDFNPTFITLLDENSPLDYEYCERCEFDVIIIEDIKESVDLNANELLNMLEKENGWNEISAKLNSGHYKINNIDINDVINTEILIETNGNYATEGLKSILKHIDTKKITKKLLSELFILEGNDSEYMEILKKIVDKTDTHKEMAFFDYEDNSYGQDTSIRLILENSNIPKENLYPAYKTSMFKGDIFNPIFLTNLTGFYSKEDYKNAKYNVIFY